MKKMNFYFNRLSAMTMVLAMVATQLAAQTCPPLNFTFPVSACSTGVAPVPGAPVAEVMINGVWQATIPASAIGTTIQYRSVVGGVGSCWNYLTVEDKDAPTCAAPGTATLTCAEDARGLATNLCRTGQFLNSTNAKACTSDDDIANFALSNNGVAVDCSPYEQRYTDVVSNINCAGATVDGIANVTKKIVRSWSLKDKYGNVSVSACTQNIYVVKTAKGSITSGDANVSCNSFSLVGFATEAGLGGTARRPKENGVDIPNANDATSCQRYAALKNVMILDVCGGGKTYMRTWEVRSKCDNALDTVLNQTITVRDITAPTGKISVDNYTLGNSGDLFCFNMSGMPNNNLQCKARTLAPVNQNLGGAAINIKAIADQTTCLMSRVVFRLSDLDGTNCTGFTGAPTVTVSDSRLSLSGGVWSGTFMFANATQVQSFTVTLTDACGNTTVQTVNVSYEDNAAPNAIAHGATIQIPAGACSARLGVAAINDFSTDNCGIRHIMFRKMGSPASTGTENCWSDVLDYSVEEACRTDNMVILRIVDNNGLCSEAMVPVVVNFKPSISCSNLADVTRTCTSNDLLNFRNLFADPATGVGSSNPGCLNVTITDDNLASLNLNISCNQSTVTRSWKATATYCNAGVTSTLTTTTCTQRLVVTPLRGFRLRTQGDSTYSCMAPTASGVVGSATWIENEKDKTIRQLSLLDCAGEKTCAAPVVEVETWEFRSNQYCKIFRVRYTIVDQCVRPFPYYEAPIWGRNPDATGCPTISARRSVIQDRADAIVYERLIYIDDRTAPTSSAPSIADICDAATADTDADACEVGFTTSLSGSDNCGGTTATSDPNVLYFMWSLQRRTGTGAWGEIATGTTTTVSRSNLPVSGDVSYRIVYRITDLCGNMSQEYTVGPFRVLDCKAPEILVHDKVVALGGRPGMANLLYADIENRITDNCAGDLTQSNKIVMERVLSTDPAAPAAPRNATPNRTVMFTCADLAAGSTRASHGVRVWATDPSGNWNYAVSTISLQDNDNICGAGAQIQGAITNNVGTAIDNVDVTARVAGSVVSASASTAAGSFAVSVPARGVNVTVSAAKTSEVDAREGVSTADIAAISRHVLGSQALANPYSIIAADVDKNGSVEALDMLTIRRFVLFLNPTMPAGSFRFVDKAYTFRNAAEPLGEDFPEVINVANIQGDVAANFTAVKLGDVNNSYRHVSVRGSRALTLTATDMEVIAGNEYTVNVNAANFDATAFQGTFSFAGLTVKSIQAGNLSNMSDANFGKFNNAVTASWNGKAAANAEVLAITFVANKSGKLSDMMSFGSAMTQAEAIATNGEAMNVTLKFNTGKVSGAEFALFQNTPNPVATSTKVGFNLPKDGAARFTVFNAEGKVLYATSNDYKAGYNEVILNKSQLAAGVLYYRLETADHSATKKMIIIE